MLIYIFISWAEISHDSSCESWKLYFAKYKKPTVQKPHFPKLMPPILVGQNPHLPGSLQEALAEHH